MHGNTNIKVVIILAQLNNYQFFCCAVVLFVSLRRERSLVSTGHIVLCRSNTSRVQLFHCMAKATWTSVVPRSSAWGRLTETRSGH